MKTVIYLIIMAGLIFQQNLLFSASDSQKLISLIELKDGTILKGKISEENSETLTIEDRSLGNITVMRKSINKEKHLITGMEYTITTKEGTSLSGMLELLDNETVIINTASLGEQKISLSTIASFEISKTRWIQNPNATRYFFAPSSIMLKKGEGYYQNSYILMNSVNYGITKNMTIGGGVILPFWFYVTPKFGFQLSKHITMASGLFYAASFMTDGEMDMGMGIGYAMITAGNIENNITLACGYGFSRFNRQWNNTQYPIAVISGTKRISERIALVTENWAVSSKFMRETTENQLNPETGLMESMLIQTWDGTYKYNGILSAGMRWMNEKMTFDFAIIIPVNVFDALMPFPYLDFVMKF